MSDVLRTMRIRALGVIVLASGLQAAGTPSPALLVLNEGGTLAIVDPASRQVVGRVPVGESPREVAVSADGTLAFVSNYGREAPGSTLSVVDLATQKELHRVDLGLLRRPHGLAVADGKLYFTAEMNKAIARYDPASNRVEWLLGTGQHTTHMILFNPGANQIYTANSGSNSVTIIDPSENETVIPVGKGPEGLDISPDGKELWVAHSLDGGVSIVNIAMKRVTMTFSVQTKRSSRLKFSPDGRLVLISDLEAGDLLVLDHRTRKEWKRVHLGHQPSAILVTPDSTRAYVAVTADNNVAVIDLKTLDLEARIVTGRAPEGMAWTGR